MTCFLGVASNRFLLLVTSSNALVANSNALVTTVVASRSMLLLDQGHDASGVNKDTTHFPSGDSEILTYLIYYINTLNLAP